jgi:hypothetical protein
MIKPLFCIVLLSAGIAAGLSSDGPDSPAGMLPAGATQCDPSLPIQVELIPLNDPQTGQTAEFEIRTESQLDPDLIQNSWIEYEVNVRGVRPDRSSPAARVAIGRMNRDQRRFGFRLVDELRREVRARYVVRLIDGRTVAQTAVRWVDPGAQDPPEGQIGTIVDPDGTAIRVYRGVSGR